MLTKDVVCGMQVNEGDNQISYRGIVYSFCSKQCRERFEANPHLYIGVPGEKAPKQEGVSVVKLRRLRLAQALSPSEAKLLIAALQSMMGIRSVLAEGSTVVIAYDLMLVLEVQIEEKLAETGIALGEGFAERLRRAFVHYEEECEIGNLEAHEHDIGPIYEAFRRGER